MDSVIELNELSSNDDHKKFAVLIKYAYKSYGKSNVVLSGLHMAIPEGTIYGLLGPSGCGKTTLLNCILGRNKLDSGEIKVKYRNTTDIGYMPQQIGLYDGFSIIETMTFYGKLFHLGIDAIEKRTDELLEFLQLPKKSRILSSLSGGQIQRVSFAVALLHNPRMLILDEPTAGVDPLLCVKMWDQFLHMTENENKTVIVTTHYIEEAGRAHTVGLMRNGKLLEENSPSQLKIQYNCSTLEDVFLQLCQKECTSTKTLCQTYDHRVNEAAIYSMLEVEPMVSTKQNFKCSKNVILALLLKNYYFTRNNLPVMMLFLLLPLYNFTLYSASFGNDPNELKIAVVNEESVEISNYEWLLSKGCNLSMSLSYEYLKKFNRGKYKLVEYHNIDAAKNAIKKNEVWGAMYFSKNYTVSLIAEMGMRMGKKSGNISPMQGDIQIWLDKSNYVITNIIQNDVIKQCLKFLRQVYTDCGWPPKLADIPIMTTEFYGNGERSFKHFAAPGIIALFQFFLPQIFTMESVLTETRCGSLDRTKISGVTMLEVAISLIIIQFIILSIQSTEIMVVMFVFYDNPMEGNLLWILLILFSTGASGMSFGFLLAVISNNAQAATFLGMGTLFGNTIFCGVFWPLQGMPQVLRYISYLLPVTQCAEAFRAVSVKDWSIFDSTVYIGFISNIIWSCIHILMTSIFVKKLTP